MGFFTTVVLCGGFYASFISSVSSVSFVSPIPSISSITSWGSSTSSLDFKSSVIDKIVISLSPESKVSEFVFVALVTLLLERGSSASVLDHFLLLEAPFEDCQPERDNSMYNWHKKRVNLGLSGHDGMKALR